jgi:hypothetical protein
VTWLDDEATGLCLAGPEGPRISVTEVLRKRSRTLSCDLNPRWRQFCKENLPTQGEEAEASHHDPEESAVEMVEDDDDEVTWKRVVERHNGYVQRCKHEYGGTERPETGRAKRRAYKPRSERPSGLSVPLNYAHLPTTVETSGLLHNIKSTHLYTHPAAPQPYKAAISSAVTSAAPLIPCLAGRHSHHIGVSVLRSVPRAIPVFPSMKSEMVQLSTLTVPPHE